MTSPSNLPSQDSAPTRGPTHHRGRAVVFGRLALAAVGRGTSWATNDHVAAKFRARRRDCGAGLQVPGGALV